MMYNNIKVSSYGLHHHNDTLLSPGRRGERYNTITVGRDDW